MWNGVPTSCNIPRDSIEEERDLGESSQCNVSEGFVLHDFQAGGGTPGDFMVWYLVTDKAAWEDLGSDA